MDQDTPVQSSPSPRRRRRRRRHHTVSGRLERDHRRHLRQIRTKSTVPSQASAGPSNADNQAHDNAVLTSTTTNHPANTENR